MASSSALGVGDIALTWDNTLGSGDMSILDMDLATDRGLATAVLLSWALDARAEKDDVPPSGDPRDRRGWWADQFADVAGDKIGCRLWLLDRAVLNNETLLRAKQYATEGVAWLIVDLVVASVDVVVTPLVNGFVIAGTFTRPNGDAVTFRYSHVWDHVQEGT